MIRAVVTIVALVATLAACSGESSADPLAVVASAPGSIGTGTQRVMFALIDQNTQEHLAAADRPAEISLSDENGAPLSTSAAEFITTIEDVQGLYSARLEFPSAGTYQVVISADGLPDAGPVGLVVVDDPLVVQPGETAPASPTRTSAEYPDLAVISSDPDPDPEMYRLSIDEAVSNGAPSVIVFATPAWCASQTCGPLLDQAKALRPDHPEVDFLHVEVYEDIQVSSFDELVTVAAVEEWGLPSEPWVFVVDSEGIVSASFEGAASDAELLAALDSLG